VRPETCSAPPATDGNPIRNDEIHRDQHLPAANVCHRDPNAGLRMPSIAHLQSETRCGHCIFQLGGSVEATWIESKVSIGCVGSNREVSGARVEIDSLSPGDDNGIALR
jgi:hypothetical protein